jgi:hypothetical protein
MEELEASNAAEHSAGSPAAPSPGMKWNCREQSAANQCRAALINCRSEMGAGPFIDNHGASDRMKLAWTAQVEEPHDVPSDFDMVAGAQSSVCH